jgi:hypothetical protein
MGLLTIENRSYLSQCNLLKDEKYEAATRGGKCWSMRKESSGLKGLCRAA